MSDLPYHQFEFASLQRCLPRWRAANADAQVLQWLEDGYMLPFNSPPHACELTNRPMSAPDHQFLQQQINEYLGLGVIEPVTQATCICRIFVVQGKKPRMIHDLRPVNQHIQAPKVKLEGTNTLALMLQPKDYMVKSDVKSGYHHILIHPDHRRFLAFRFGAQLYQWKVLPFGLSTAPFVFVKTMRVTLRLIREAGIRCNLYMDDWLLAAQSKEQLLQDQHKMWSICHELGWALSPAKSVTLPTQHLEYLGFLVDTTGAPALRIPASKRQSLRHSLAQILKKQGTTKRHLAQVLGSCVAMTRAWMPAKLLLNPAFRLLKSAQAWGEWIQLTQQVSDDLLWFFRNFKTWDGGQLLAPDPPKVVIETDASPTGWGAVLKQPGLPPIQAAGHWTHELSQSSNNLRELTAVRHALLSFHRHLQPHSSVRILSDNTTTVAYINKFGGRFATLDEEARIILQLASTRSWTLSAKHIPGLQNVIPDQLSRRLDRADWKLNSTLFQLAENLWGPHTIDRFATAINRQTPRFNSAMPQPGSEAIDALTQDWSNENNWINPPWRLIPQVLNKLHRERAQATVILPWWPAQSWWPHMLRLLQDQPVLLPHTQGTFLPCLPTCPTPEPSRLPNWRAIMVRLSGNRSSRILTSPLGAVRSSSPCQTPSSPWGFESANSCSILLTCP
ncbi:MAG: hypothetical protein A2340_12880 [Lentisphaerae bacterium RIFOXYB12_FULL_60_10]|nr:MAG: hypothetical protein A2340_12880 [Lentisphaerae bacterium RIFOXYB12_FULL_60_10]